MYNIFTKETPPIPQSVIQEIFQGSRLTSGEASRFYNPMRQSNPPKLDGLKTTWEFGIEGKIANELKEIVWCWCKTSWEVQTLLITSRIIHRGYWTPCRMAIFKTMGYWYTLDMWQEQRHTLNLLYECQMTWNLWENVIIQNPLIQKAASVLTDWLGVSGICQLAGS